MIGHARREPRLEDVGEDPDPRFTLANERTFLAWIRTALALLAAGLAVAELLKSEPYAERLVVSLPLIVLGGWIGITSHGRWQRLERALRLGRSLPPARLTRALGIVVGGVTVAAMLMLVTR